MNWYMFRGGNSYQKLSCPPLKRVLLKKREELAPLGSIFLLLETPFQTQFVEQESKQEASKVVSPEING